ncbi:MAG: hypothetical protein ABR588_01800 [Sphingomicrobium sp.]
MTDSIAPAPPSSHDSDLAIGWHEVCPVEDAAAAGPASRWSTAALPASCAAFFLFGICLIANAQVPSNGTWDLYARLMGGGARLYSDLRLPLQPLFVLMTYGWQQLLGDSSLASQVPAVLDLGLFTAGFYLLARRGLWRGWQKTVVFLGAASVAIAFNWYLFNDYRVLTDVANLYSILVLLHLLDRPASSPIRWIYSLALGILSGLSFTTRANDGLLLMLSVAAILFHSFPGQRLRIVPLFFGGAVATALSVIALTGDSLISYGRYSLLSSPASKGGIGQVILSPFLLAGDLVSTLLQPTVLTCAAIFAAAAALPVLWVRTVPVERASRRQWLIALGAIVVATFECFVIGFFNRIAFDCVATVVAPMLILPLILVSLWGALGVIHVVKIDNRRSLLFLVPFGALVAGGMSTGGKVLGLYGPVGLFMVIVPIVFTLQRRVRWARGFALSIYALLAMAVIVGKVQHPLLWQNYRAKPMFTGRALVDHPLYGPMIVDRVNSRFFAEACRTIRTSEATPELLSMPYSYANYYCGIEPWGRNVQTFFDTTNPATIRTIGKGLATKPPAWILYERQLNILRVNEVAYHHGGRSHYRDLDEYIEGQVVRGHWTIVRRWSEIPGDDWQLIRTSVEGTPPPSVQPTRLERCFDRSDRLCRVLGPRDRPPNH